LKGYVKKSVIKTWLKYLVEQPLYKQYDIKVHRSVREKTDAGEHDDTEKMDAKRVPDSAGSTPWFGTRITVLT
jgi:hypothetical protein